jgi:hypothetical protein
VVRALPEVLSQPARQGIRAAAQGLPAGWDDDSDLGDLFDDVEATLTWTAAATRVKGASAIRRLTEFFSVTPRRLLDALATHGACDLLLSSFVAARCGVGKRARPREWRQDGLDAPSWRDSVRAETSALIGLMRLSRVLPPDARGTIPLTRAVLRKCGCLGKNEASPRAYTFMWELEAAYRLGTPLRCPRAFAVFTLCVIALCFLLRPRYARWARRHNLWRAHADGAERYRFRWGAGDKTNVEAVPSATARAAAAARPRRRAADPGTGAAGGAAGPSGGPVALTRLTAARHTLLDSVVSEWVALRRPLEDPGVLVCRTEVRRRAGALPAGSRAAVWRGIPVLLWPDTPLSSPIIHLEMRRFLAPVVPPRALRLRIFSGLRGGGEMELTDRRVDVSVRATLGWWRARRVSAEGAMVTYEGCSVEAMYDATVNLGSTFLRVLAPGVYSTAPPVPPARTVRGRCLRASAALRSPTDAS